MFLIKKGTQGDAFRLVVTIAGYLRLLASELKTFESVELYLYVAALYSLFGPLPFFVSQAASLADVAICLTSLVGILLATFFNTLVAFVILDLLPPLIAP